MIFMKKILLCFVLIFSMVGCSKEKAQTIDVSPYLYKISDENNNYVYLLGTCHPGRDKIDKLDDITEAAIRDSDAIALECSLDQNEMKKYQHYLFENSIEDMGLTSYLSKIKKTYPSLSNYQLGQYNAMALSSLANADLMNDYGGKSENAIDMYLFNLTKEKNIPFKEVEGVEFQMKLFANLSKESPHAILESLDHRDEQIKSAKTILDSYYNHDVDTLYQFYSYKEAPNSQYKNEYDIYQKLLITDRNAFMQQKLIEYMNSGEIIFVGVGVGHVTGDNGLIVTLKDAGYKVECLNKK